MRTYPVSLGIVLSLGLCRAHAVDFQKDIKPLLESSCISCHGPSKQEAELRLDSKEALQKGSEDGAVLLPGQPEKSSLYTSTVLPEDDDKVMPPKKKGLLHKEQAEVLKKWIEAGAPWPNGVILTSIPRVNFTKDVQPLLETQCVGCHHEGHDEGGLRLDQKSFAFNPTKSGEPAIIPGDPAKSSLYTSTTLPASDDDLMPPKKKGGPLPKEATEILKNWIASGAFWPSDAKLVARKAEGPATGDESALVAQIFQRIQAAPLVESAEMKAYSTIIPGSDVQFDMVPIPGGKFKMGGPQNEPGHQEDETPQHDVRIDPFWMEKCEVTWNEFELFMYPNEEKNIRATKKLDPALNALTDAVTHPTQPYVEMSFGMGKSGYPAISMTQHAANKYCEWLSAKTGQFYRLPTEAEWEYAARAGTTTAYFWGNDPSQLGEYAWWGQNADFKYQKVGKKKPNPWGLYDMIGNVVEWCLDQYNPNYYKNSPDSNPWNRATKAYPHVVRGGSWDDDDPTKLRVAARRGSDPSWKVLDPQLPKSVWYHTSAQFLGFRIVRPLNAPSADEMRQIWNSGVEKDNPELNKP